MAGKYVDFLRLLKLQKGVVNMLAAFTTLLFSRRIRDCVVAHGVIARPARRQSFMHAHYHSADSTVVLPPFERAIKPLRLIAGEDPGRIVQRDEINSAPDPKAAELGCRQGCSRKAELTQLRNEASLNCVSLRSQLDCEVSCKAVKGQDERRHSAAPLTASQPTTPALPNTTQN